MASFEEEYKQKHLQCASQWHSLCCCEWSPSQHKEIAIIIIQQLNLYTKHHFSLSSSKSTEEQAARVRVCNYIKFETGQKLRPLLKIVTHTAQLCRDVGDCC